MSAAVKRREYFVGGTLQTQSWWLMGISRVDLIAGLAGLTGLVIFVALRQPILGIVAFTSSVIVIVVMRVRKLTTRGNTTTSGVFTRLLLAWAGFNRHDGRGRPAAFGDMKIVSVDVDGHDLGLVETGSNAKACVTAVFKLDPVTVGVGEWVSDDWRATQMSRFVARLAASAYPMDAIQIVSRVYPADTREWELWSQNHLVADKSLVTAVAEVGTDVSLMSCSVETFLAVKIPMNQLAEWASTQGIRPQSRDDLYEIAASLLDSVVADIASFGLRPVKVFSTNGLRSLMRGWFDCSFFLDEPVADNQFSGWWPIPAWRIIPGERGVAVNGTKGFWVHSSGVIDASGWPAWTVHADFLADLVRDVEPGQVRTFSITWVPIPQRVAMDRARAASAMAQAGQEQLNKKGSVGSGVEEDQQDAAHWLLRDLRSGASGVGVVARVGVAGRDVSALSRGRADADRLAVGAGVKISWCDHDQVRGVCAGLPIALGVREIRKSRR